MPEKVVLAQTLILNVSTCMGQPLTFAESRRTVHLKDTVCFLLSVTFSFLSRFCLRSFLTSHWMPFYSLWGVWILSCMIRIVLFVRICFSCSSDGDSRDRLESPRLAWFIHDNGFLETLIEFRAWMLSDWRLCLRHRRTALNVWFTSV